MCLCVGALGAAFVGFLGFMLCLFVGRRCVVVLCHRSAVGGLFLCPFGWFWRSLYFLDVSRKGLVCRCSVLAVSIIMYFQIFVGADRRCCVVRLFGFCFFVPCFFCGEGLVRIACWFLAIVPSSLLSKLLCVFRTSHSSLVFCWRRFSRSAKGRAVVVDPVPRWVEVFSSAT